MRVVVVKFEMEKQSIWGSLQQASKVIKTLDCTPESLANCTLSPGQWTTPASLPACLGPQCKNEFLSGIYDFKNPRGDH
eukprot:7110484-Prorocentrum_lima.AAC.1